jgi:hypothetical protein
MQPGDKLLPVTFLTGAGSDAAAAAVIDATNSIDLKGFFSR